MEPNNLDSQNQSSDMPKNSSSSSSIYSSPRGTPIEALPIQNIDLYNMIENESSYKELMNETKNRMSRKFDQLEKENGINLNEKTFVNNYLEKHSELNENSIQNLNSDLQKNQTLKQKYHDCETDSKFLEMEANIKRLKDELNSKNDIIIKMCKIKSQVESELEDLTVSLFEEANKMVYQANVLRDKVEKELYEANMTIDMLNAEVHALKYIITSFPSSEPDHKFTKKSEKKSPFSENSNKPYLPIKSPSNYELGKKELNKADSTGDTDLKLPLLDDKDGTMGEIDPVFFEEFNEWKKTPSLEPMNSNFMKRIYDEEIYPVFNFKNKNLTSSILRSIENNTLTVETVNNDRLPFPKKCALLEISRICRFRMRIDDEKWHNISQLCRNRIAAVCDLFCYLRYIQDGLVKSNFKDIYWQVMRRRRNIALSKLGFHPST